MYESIDDKIGQLEMLKEKYLLYLSQINHFYVQVERKFDGRRREHHTGGG